MSCDINSFDDIEDLVQVDDEPTTRLQRHELQPRAKKRTRNVEKPVITNEEDDDTPVPIGDNIPGLGSIYIKTWGCAHNNSDGEYMAGLLAQYGYEITENPDRANLWLLNSCTGTSPAQLNRLLLHLIDFMTRIPHFSEKSFTRSLRKHY